MFMSNLLNLPNSEIEQFSELIFFIWDHVQSQRQRCECDLYTKYLPRFNSSDSSVQSSSVTGHTVELSFSTKERIHGSVSFY